DDPGNTLGFGAAIISGPDGNIWFSESAPGKIARMAPSSGAYSPFQVRAFYPEGIVGDTNGHIWYALKDGAAIGRIGLDGSGNMEFPLSSGTADPGALIFGPDNNLW